MVAPVGNDFRLSVRDISHAPAQAWQAAASNQARRAADASGTSFITFDPLAANKRNYEVAFAKIFNNPDAKRLGVV